MSGTQYRDSVGYLSVCVLCNVQHRYSKTNTAATLSAYVRAMRCPDAPDFLCARVHKSFVPAAAE
eukprot:860214-Rhodomonas_salina.1